jgi:hypothetical protein
MFNYCEAMELIKAKRIKRKSHLRKLFIDYLE